MTSLRRPPMHCPCRRELSGQLIGSANAGDGRRTESCPLETGTKVTPSARSMLTPEDAAKPASSGVSIERADGVTFVPVSREHDSVRLPSPAFADPINCPLNSRRQGQCIGGRRRDVINGPGRPPFRDQQSTKWMADAVALGRPADVPVRQLGVKPPKPSVSVTDGARSQPCLPC